MVKLDKLSNPTFFGAIKANTVFSLFCGLCMVLFPGAINDFLGASVIIDLPVIGLFLVAFALWLAYLIWRNGVSRRDAWAIVIGDLLWVLFTVLLLSCYTDAFSTGGLLLIGMTGVVVGIFAGLQALSLAKEGRLDPSSV